MTKTELIAFETCLKELWESGKLRTPIHFCGGNETQLIDIFKDIAETDWVFSTHRNHYHYLLHTVRVGVLLDKIICENNSMHIIDLDNNFISTAIVGGNVAMAVGTAYALKLKDSSCKVWCFIGDGACDQGWFFEAYRYAIGQDLPITFVIEDNNRSVETRVEERWGVNDAFMDDIALCPKVIYYRYTPTYPHVGTGRPIEW